MDKLKCLLKCKKEHCKRVLSKRSEPGVSKVELCSFVNQRNKDDELGASCLQFGGQMVIMTMMITIIIIIIILLHHKVNSLKKM
jgi:hypothetical protein